MSHHWNYFLAIEEDIERISRYIEFAPSNFSTYSIEIARVLMASTQEIDVLLKQICQSLDKECDRESQYQIYIMKYYPNIVNARVELPRFSIEFLPFENWRENVTPEWWTANNKVKHERHNLFHRASLENMLNSVCALFIANLYYHHSIERLSELVPGTKILNPIDMIDSLSPTEFGIIPNYKIL